LELQVKCPLQGCGAIFARESTPAGVRIEGLGEKVDDLLRNHVVGADLNEITPQTHALLPLPGGFNLCVPPKGSCIDVYRPVGDIFISLGEDFLQIYTRIAKKFSNGSCSRLRLET
jgi:hypothetical protein